MAGQDVESGREQPGEPSRGGASSTVEAEVASADIGLDRDVFLRSLLRRLAGTLEDLVGLEETSGFVSVVGDEIGHLINEAYKRSLGTDQLGPEQVAAVLVDLKRRIEGDFYMISQDEDRIVLGNRACPFGDKVVGRSSLCMMTSNVFGSITAENLGYARVELEETIARGATGCRVVVHLQPSAEIVAGREYYAGVVPTVHDPGADAP